MHSLSEDSLPPTTTIVALATPPGTSALALLRLTGPDSLSCLTGLLLKPYHWIPRQAIHLELWTPSDSTEPRTLLDDVVATYWKAPHSFTGEDTLELSCHGNPLIIQKILTVLYQQGIQPAAPGEFTQRAFLQGKLDLTQAEAILDLIEASTGPALQGARAMKEGKLASQLHSLRSELIDLLAHIEAHIDFPEEDIEPQTYTSFEKCIGASLVQIQELLHTAPLGRILREGVTTAIIGAPNVGKSSLLNALLRENRSIVSSIPGTTRDTIEAECHIAGLRLRLIDTAGQRVSDNPIETEGIRRAIQATEQARLILHLIDGSQPASSNTFSSPSLRPDQIYLKIANKSDLPLHPDHYDLIPANTLHPTGLQPLEHAIQTQLITANQTEHQGWLTLNARQEAALLLAQKALEQADKTLHTHASPELISIDLRHALDAIGDIIGLTTNEDILDQLFQNFCIGK